MHPNRLAPTPPRPPIAGRYALEHLVGGGTWTTVHRARSLPSDARVAVKLMAPDVAAHPLASARFDREVHISTTLGHPFVARGLDAGVEPDGTRYLVMEWLEGQSLRQRIDTSGPLTPNEVVRLGLQLSTALVETHALGWLHRDLTPANTYLCASRRVVLFDFGMAGPAAARSGRRLTRVGASVGTLHYMAPEQIGGQAEPASDLFSLGVVLYEALCGRHPWPVVQPAAYIAALRERSAPSLASDPACGHAPLSLCAFIDQLTSRDPACRPASAADALGAFLEISARGL